MQKVQSQEDRERNLLAVWHLDERRFVRLGTDLVEEVSLLEGQAFAVAQHTDPYAFTNMFGRRWMHLHVRGMGRHRSPCAERFKDTYGHCPPSWYIACDQSDHTESHGREKIRRGIASHYTIQHASESLS